jgi:hypothetical protein
MSDELTDMRRELDKAAETLKAVERHLARQSEANAALHCSEKVMYSPLHAKVAATIQGIENARTRKSESVGLLKVLSDLCRCQHGRHEGDTCGDCGGTSHGNPHMPPGKVIGYGLYGDQIVRPPRDQKYDPAAWRRQ